MATNKSHLITTVYHFTNHFILSPPPFHQIQIPKSSPHKNKTKNMTDSPLPTAVLLRSDRIPYDIVSDIFRQLPAKTLLRFRSLSKPLSELIDSYDFIRHHLAHSLHTKSNHSLILRDWHLHTVDLDSPDEAHDLAHPLYSGGGTEAVGSVNGLIALRNSERDLAIYNIATRQVRKLPVSEVEPPGGQFLRTGYVFYGFGFDSVHDDYKLVRMATFVGDEDACDTYNYNYEVKVYSYRTNSWKKIKEVPFYLRFLHKPLYQVLHRRGYGVLVGSALHWMLPQRPTLGLKDYIVSFDFVAEQFVEISQPVYENREMSYEVDVGALDGNLCAMCNYDHVCVDLWVMKEYGVKESWTRLFSVQRIRSTTAFAFLRPLMYSKDGKELLLEVNDERLVWYDWNSGKARPVRIRGSPKSFGAVICVESLIPIDDPEEVERQERRRVDAEREKLISQNNKWDDFLSVGFKLKL
ncbi:F-box protein CPR1 [Linum grandiflorum]